MASTLGVKADPHSTCLVRAAFVVALLVCSMSTGPAGAVDYYVATDGADSNSGTTLGQPFRTIQKAADLVLAGDNVYVRQGTYRETVSILKTATAASPITFQPYQGERATITGLDEVSSSWSPHSGSIYRVPVTGGASQVFVDGKAMHEARWPNAVYNNPLRANQADVSTASMQTFPSISTITSSTLTGAGNYAGGKVAINGGNEFVAITGAVTGGSGNSLNFQWPSLFDTSVYHPKPGSDFYIYDTLAALDSPKEWYYDSSASQLYLQAPGNVDPSTQTVEVRKRDLAFDIQNFSEYINISGFQIKAAGINVAGDKSTLDNLQIIYPTAFTDPQGWDNPTTPFNPAGVRISGFLNTVSNSEIAYSWGDGVKLAFSRNTVDNNLIHDADWNGTDAAPVNADGSGGRNTISNNTLYNAGRSGVLFRYLNPDTDILSNDISRFGYITKDLGGIYTFLHEGQTDGTVVAYNKIRDVRDPNIFDAGIYMDVGTTPPSPESVTVHHNVVTDTPVGVLFYPNNHNIYNNTLWDVNQAVKVVVTASNVNTINNLSNSTTFHGSTVSNNWAGSDPFVNSAAGDYTLAPGSGPVDFGMVIPGITDGYTGSAPDAGAFESGTPAWTAGSNFKTWLFADQVIAPLTSAVTVAQSGQQDTTGPLVVGNVSSTSNNNRVFLDFDLSAVTQAIDSAVLRIYENDLPTSANGAAKVLNVLADWTPGTLTYNQAVDTGTSISGFYDPANLDLYTDIDITSMVLGWLADPSSNFGLSLRGTEGLTQTAKFFEGFYGVTAPQLVITFATVAPENADFDGSGFVDGADFLAWQRGFGTGTTLAQGDANGDMMVDAADLAIWETQYGTSPLAAVSSAVPEPSSLLFSILAGCFRVAARRREPRVQNRKCNRGLS